MGSWLYNILSQLRAARDLIVTAGPTTAYAIARAAEQVAAVAKEVGRFIEQYGPQVQFNPLIMSSSAEIVQYRKDLGDFKADCERLATAPARAQGAPQSRADSEVGRLLQEMADLAGQALDVAESPGDGGQPSVPQATKASASRAPSTPNVTDTGPAAPHRSQAPPNPDMPKGRKEG